MASTPKYRFSSRYDPSSNCSRAPEAGALSPIYKGCREISLCSQRSNAKHGSSTGAFSSFLFFERLSTKTCIERTSLDSKHNRGSDTPIKVSKQGRLHRPLREWFNVHREFILSSWAWGTVKRFFQFSRCVSTLVMTFGC